MSRYNPGLPAPQPVILPPTNSESKRDRKRRETINKIEMLHDESWHNRDEKFSSLYKEYHNENKAVNSQPPTSSKYLLRLYPHTIERDALIEAAEVEYQYKTAQANKMYESERETIEAQYWDTRDQVRQRLLGAIEERRRKLREEKEGGDVITESLLEAQIKHRPIRRIRRRSDSPSRDATPHIATSGNHIPSPPPGNPSKSNDLLLHGLLAPSLAQISTDDIIHPNSSSLAIIPAATTVNFNQPTAKRGPRGKNDPPAEKEVQAAPGTLTALAIASGQQSTNPKSSRNAGAQQGGWVIGKSLAELKRMESASTLEIESDWARIQGANNGRGRRNRGD